MGEVAVIYQWLLSALQEEFEPVRLLKESPRGAVELVRHRATGRRFVLHRFTGSAEVYRVLLDYDCPNLPQVLETASLGEENLVLEEYVQGDTLDFLLRGGQFSARETRKIVSQLCRALWVLHSLGAVHRDVKPENVILRGREAVLIDFDAARLHKPEHRTDTQVLGTTKSQHITTLIADLVAHSTPDALAFSPDVEAAYLTLHDFMYATVYVDEVAKREERKVEKMLSELYERLVSQPELLPGQYLEIAYREGPDRAATDYISGMSDEFATRTFEELFVPRKWHVL